MKRKTAFACTVLLWLFISLGVLFCVLRVFVNRPGYFQKRYEQLGIQDAIGISTEDCTRAVYRLIDYMEGREQSIQLRVTENGTQVDMYNAQEMAHMIDVRELYQAWRRVSYFALAALCCLMLISLLSKGARAFLWKAYKASWLVFGALLLIMLAWVLIDFNGFWFGFHRLFFDNELWLMDPNVCRMIRICPLELFYGIVLGTVLTFAGICALCSLALRGLYKRTTEEKKKA